MRALVAYCYEKADRFFMTILIEQFARDPPCVFVASFSCDATTEKLTLPMLGLEENRVPSKTNNT